MVDKNEQVMINVWCETVWGDSESFFIVISQTKINSIKMFAALREENVKHANLLRTNYDTES